MASGKISLSNVLETEEFETISETIKNKIEEYITTNLDEYLTAKAVYETSKSNYEENITKLSEELGQAKADRDSIQNKLSYVQDELNELKEKHSSAQSELFKCQERINRLEKENSTFRQERNIAVDDRQEALQMIERRDSQLKRLQDSIKDLSEQLESAIRTKCVAIAKNDDIEGRKMELDHKEKMFKKEKELLLERINNLTCDISKHSTDLCNLRRENTANIMLVQGQLSEKTEELRQTLSANAQLNDNINKLKEREEFLMKKLSEQCENENKMAEDYQQEIKTQTKLADLYKGLSEEAASKNAELTMAVKELQKLLQDASDQYGSLETKMKEEDSRHEAIVKKKLECIETMKKELECANELIKTTDREKLENVVESLSPAAAAAGRLIKSGMTMTQVYCLYAQVSEELLIEKQQTKKLNLYIETILKEIEEKAPILKKQREDYEYAMNTVETLSAKIESMENESARLRHDTYEFEKKTNYLTRENKRLSTTITDLSRQVCFLLKEVEESRGVAVPLTGSSEQLQADIKTSKDVIAKHLVTFSDIQELQATNQKILAVIRELSSKQEQDEEERDNAKVADLKERIRILENNNKEIMENYKQLRTLVDMAKSQRDRYKMLFNQFVKGKNASAIAMEVDDVPENLANKSQKIENLKKPLMVSTEKNTDLETKLKEKIDELAALKNEFTEYRKEKGINDKMANEELERCRNDLMKKIKQICELSGKVEYAEQTIKTLQTNAKVNKTHIASLESKINNYTAITAKHEQTIIMLRDEAMNTSSKLARAEVTLEHLKQENQLLKESEARISKERDMLIRESRRQELLLSNIEKIKMSMERSENDSRLRLETQVEDLTKECICLQHRLQDEQDLFRGKVELLEKQTAQAKQRQEEEVQLAASVRAELEEAQKLLKDKQEQIDTLNQKIRDIKHTIVPDPTADEKIKLLQDQCNQKKLEVEALTNQLTLSKNNAQDFQDMAQLFQDKLADLSSKYSKEKEEMTAKIKELEEKEAEVTTVKNKLQEEVNTLTANKEESIKSLRELMNTQKNELTETKEEYLKNKLKLETTFDELKKLQMQYDVIEKKYSTTEVQNTQMQKELIQLKEELETLREDYKKIELAKNSADEALHLGEQNWLSKESSFKIQIDQMQERLTNLNEQNELLHEQLESLGLKLSISNTKESTSVDTSSPGKDTGDTDQLMQVVKYLREEKNHAICQNESLSNDNLNLRAQVDVLTKQLEEVSSILAEERSSKDSDSVTATKYNELIKKVETLNTIIDENNALKEEKVNKTAKITELEQQIEKIENQIVRTNEEKISKLLEQVNQLSTENVSLKNESSRWKERSNTLLERSNKNSPEDFKRLMLEKENLLKQLNAEKEENKKRAVEKTKLDQQLTTLKQENQSLKDEFAQLSNEVSQLNQRWTESKEDSQQKADEIATLKRNFANQEKALNELRNKEVKIRQIAKRYKTRYEELCDVENKEGTSGEVNLEAQERLREEGRREAETSQAERLKELSDQVSTTQAEADTLRKENNLLKSSSLDKEERAKHLLKNARQRIMQLTEDKNKLNKELGDIRTRLDNYDRNKEELARRSEREKIDVEKERLSREVELLTQRLNLMQRQLEKQQGSKPSTSSGLTEKMNVDPPTANIKPMAGPSSSGSKQPNIQHSATVTPWRGGPETPFASIRPISQSRTAAVHPTTNQSQGQAILVPPQQQMVHTSTGVAEALSSSSPTSSHTDYMPATSSAVTIRQATVPPTQSTQDTDTDAENQQQGQSSSNNSSSQPVSIALVLPQPTAQTSSSQTTQTLVVSAENSSVVSASNQEQSLDHSVVSASSHTPSIDQSFVSASSGHTQMCMSSASSYYRQQEVDETAGQSEQSVVASSQQQVEQSVTVSSQQAGSSEQGMSDQSVASSQQSEQSVASSHHGVSEQAVASSRNEQSVASSVLSMSEQSVLVASSQTSTSSNTVTTTQTAQGMKRPRDSNLKPNEEGESSKSIPSSKRSRVMVSVGETSGEMLFRADGLEVEYQVPTSSQRDQEDDVILVDTTDEDEDDDEGMPDEGDMGMASYEGEGPDIDENINDQDNNEVEIIEDSNEVPNQSESSSSGPAEGTGEATSSGHPSVSSNQGVAGHFARRPSGISPLNRQQQLLLPPQNYEDPGDDSIVPSTPTLFVPRRTDGFGEAISSPHVPSGRFTFSDNTSGSPSTRAGVAQVASEGIDDTRMDLSQLEDNGTSRNVPTAPLQVSPHESTSSEIGQSTSDEPPITMHSGGDNLNPNITITISHELPPPSSLVELGDGSHAERSMDVMDEPELHLEIPEESGDGVSSEGEKSQMVAEEMDEGREAEASEAGPSRSSTPTRGSGTARRSNRQATMRSRAGRPPPQRITWNEENNPGQRGQFVRVRTTTPPRGGVADRGTAYRSRARRMRNYQMTYQPRF